MKSPNIFWVAAWLLGWLAVPATPQEPPRVVYRFYTMKIKPGMEKQFDEGRKRHVEWHRQQKDTWGWYAGQIVTGPRAGQYVFTTWWRTWSDFDQPAEFAAGDAADAAVNMDPYVESETNAFYVFLPAVSRQELGDFLLYEVISFHLNPGSANDFVAVLGRIHEAIAKTHWVPGYEWYVLANGGEQPGFVLVVPRRNWAAFAPPAESLEAMLAEVYGREEAASLLGRFFGAVHCQRSEVVQSRPELAYTPPPPAQ